MRRSAEEMLIETLSVHKGIQVDKELLFYIRAYCSTLVSATSKWLAGDDDIPVDQYVRWLGNCIPRPLYDAINKDLPTT